MEESRSCPSSPIPIFSNFASNRSDYGPEKSDSPSKGKKPLSLWPRMHHSPVTIALWETRSKIFERLLDPPLDAPPQTRLLTKTPSRSRMTIVYNFSTDFVLREQYRDPWNEVRIGKLLEDLDALAGTISVKHCSDNDSTTRPLYLVTASVDKMALKKPISVDVDLHVSGAVTWVGRSSIEIQLDVTQSATGMMPSFLEVDHVDFLRPVDVGDFLRLNACVLYTESESSDQPLIHLEVVAHVTRPELRSSEVSNKFYFTFTFDRRQRL